MDASCVDNNHIYSRTLPYFCILLAFISLRIFSFFAVISSLLFVVIICFEKFLFVCYLYYSLK